MGDNEISWINAQIKKMQRDIDLLRAAVADPRESMEPNKSMEPNRMEPNRTFSESEIENRKKDSESEIENENNDYSICDLIGCSACEGTPRIVHSKIKTDTHKWVYSIGDIVTYTNRLDPSSSQRKVGVVVGLDPEPRQNSKRKGPCYLIKANSTVHYEAWDLREEGEIIGLKEDSLFRDQK